MAGLEEQMEGVSRESLPEKEEVETTVEEKPTESEAQAKDEEGKTKDEGRTPENIYRETTRKLDKFRDDQQQFQRDVLNQITGMAEKIATNSTAPAAPAVKTLEDYSVAELSTIRNGLEKEDPRIAEIDTLIARRYVSDEVDSRVSAVTARQEVEHERKRAGELAQERFPDLNDETSEFYQKVDRKLRQMSPTLKENNPRIVLDTANEVAISEGVTAKTTRTLRSPDRPGANQRDNAKPAPKTKEEYIMPLEEAKRIAGKLKDAMGREFTDKEIDNIRKGHNDYHENRGMFTTG
jgi:hypothetical protein